MSDQNNNNADQAPQGQGQDQETQKPLFELNGRTFQTQDEVINKIQNADSHIQTLEQERKADQNRIRELEQQLQSQGDLSSKLDEALNKLGESRQDNPTEATSQVDIESLSEQLLRQSTDAASQTIQQYEASKLKQQNLTSNIETAKKIHGEQYEQKLREEGQKLGLTDDDIKRMAEGSPEVFNRMFGLNKPKPQNTVDPRTSVQSRHPAHKVPAQEDLPDPTRAWDGNSRVRAMQAHLEAAMKRRSTKS